MRLKDPARSTATHAPAPRSPTLYLALLCAALLCAALFCVTLPAAAQATKGPGGFPDTIFEQLTQKNGLPGQAVQAIAQDCNGFLWIGTESGLARWDGYQFRIYAVHPGVAGSLPSNNIMTIHLDPEKRLWVATNNGLALYEPATDTFKNFTPTGPAGKYTSIYSIVTDGAHGLWLATRKGLDHFDPATGNFRVHQPVEGFPNGFNTQAVLRDANGTVWAGGTKGLFVSTANGQPFRPIPLPVTASIPAKQPTVWSLFRDHAGSLWIGTTAGTLVLEPGATTAHPVHETGPASPLDTQGVDAIIEPEPGIIWLGTYGEGIVEVDNRTGITHRILHQPSVPTSLSHNLVDAFFRDRTGTIWAGSLGGLSRKNPGDQSFQTFFGGTGDPAHPIVDADVAAVLPTPDRRLWLGLMEKGIEVFDPEGHRLDDPSPSPAFKMQIVSAFAPAPNGTMYFSSQQGIFSADRNGRHIKPVLLTTGSHAVTPLLYDSGKLWLGATDGLWAHSLAGVNNSAPNQHAIVPGPVAALARGQGNDLWVGTVDALYRVDIATLAIEKATVHPGLPGALPAAINSLRMDPKGQLWVSTNGAGLYRLQGRDSAGQLEFQQITTMDVGQTFQAPDGNLWFAADHAVNIMDPATFKITSLKHSEGLAIDDFWLNGGALASDGRLFLGGTTGLTIFQPQPSSAPTQHAPVMVTRFEVGEKPDPRAEFLANSGSASVVIQPGTPSLSVEFAASDFAAPDANRFAYRLVGFDRDWIPADSSHRVARYTNLSPGSYQLQIRAMNEAGPVGKLRSIAIRILPAWYQTLWFRLAQILAALTAIFWLVRLYTAMLRATQKHLERKVTRRTLALKDITVKLQQSQQKLEQIAYLDSLTGLANRRRFTDCFQQFLNPPSARPFTMLLLDLDKFKSINDNFGHDVGDALLEAVATRLTTIATEHDCLARLGGDEFALLLADTSDPTHIDEVCRRILRVIEQPLDLSEKTFHISVSIGAATYPRDGELQKTLFKSADVALYQVKHEGRHSWRRYTAEPEISWILSQPEPETIGAD